MTTAVVKGIPACFQKLPDSAHCRCSVWKKRAQAASGSATTLLSPIDSSSTGISKQRCELPAGVDLSPLLPLSNPSHRWLSDVNVGLRISLPIIFGRGLVSWWITFDQSGVLHVSFLVIKNVEREEGNHYAALSLLPASTAISFFEIGLAKDANGVGIITHSKRKIPLPRLTCAIHRLLRMRLP
jgi:hypothetical protein